MSSPTKPGSIELAAGSDGFEGFHAARSRKYGWAFTIFLAIFMVAQVLALVFGINNLSTQTIIGLSSIIAMHLGMSLLPSRFRTPRLRKIVVFLDCVMLSINHPEVISLSWELTGGMVGHEAPPYPYNHNWGMRTTFVFYVMISYLANFVLLFREVMLVVPLAICIHCCFIMGSCVAVRYIKPVPPWQVGFEDIAYYTDYIVECFVVCVATALMVLAKKAAEKAERQIFQLLAETQSRFIEEKVLRCQAEFSMEGMRDRIRSNARKEAGSPPGVPQEADLTSDHHSASVSGPSQTSAYTAPALLSAPRAREWPGLEPIADACCVDMDCLPPDAMVCAEGDEDPVLLRNLELGKKVLCFDSLGGRVRYVDVMSVSQDHTAVEWVQVELEDGTQLPMTADHPVRLADKSEVVEAGGLTSGQDHVVVHKVTTAPARVVRVSALDDMAPSARVAVTIRQPARHSILVTMPPGRGGPRPPGGVSLMAVGSADLQQERVDISRTFVHARSGVLPTPPPCGSTQSAPTSPRDRNDHAFARAGLGQAPNAAPFDEARSSSHSSLLRIADWESDIEQGSDGNSVIVLPWSGALDRTQVDAGGQLSAIMQTQRGGLPSVGSGAHERSACNPCTYAMKGRCRYGMWCRGCHFEHKKVRGKLRMYPWHRPRQEPDPPGSGGVGRRPHRSSGSGP